MPSDLPFVPWKLEGIAQRNDFLGWTREQIADWIVASELDCEAMLDCSPEREAGMEQTCESMHKNRI